MESVMGSEQRDLELYDYRRVLRHYLRNRREDLRQDLAIAWLRIAVADLEDRGVKLSADEVAGMMHLDDASRAAEEIARDHLGHYPGAEDVTRLRRTTGPLQDRILALLGEARSSGMTSRELAAQIGVRRNAVHNSLRRLRDRGLVRVEKGRPTRNGKPTKGAPCHVYRLCEVNSR